MPRTILVIDDEENIRDFLSHSFQVKGYEVYTSESGERGLEIVRSGGIDLVILDIRLPDMSGMEVLKKIMAHNPEALVIMITAYGEIKNAVEAMKLGAYDYIPKPFEFAEIEMTVAKALKVVELENEIDLLKRQGEWFKYEDMVGKSESMKEVFKIIDRMAKTPDSTVLITGESGTGKELVAKAIHRKSDRRDKPFIVINCTALPENLLESELFGHEKGAFTDAKETKKGLFEIADGGTMLLDEIVDMDVRLQSKILRVLEERSFRRVGGMRDIKVDVRMIAATNRNLEEAIKTGKFREDLYFRLKVLPTHLPPLRERKEDIIPLAESFITEYNRKFGKKVTGLTPEAKRALLNYYWPGNIRELKNLIERIFILENCTEIDVGNLPTEILMPKASAYGIDMPPEGSFKEAKAKVVDKFEENYLRELLTVNKGNVSRSAVQAKMKRSNLQRLLRKHSIKSSGFKPSV